MDTGRSGELRHGHATSDVGPAFEPAFYQLDALAEVPLFEGVSARFVAGGRMMFSFIHLAPGATVATHDHPHEQLGYVLEGSMRLVIGVDECDLQPVVAYAIPVVVCHSAVGGPACCLDLDVIYLLREEYL